jgi:TetR/AcrR family fatty acid metabolism transcriptional regulator
MVKKKDKRERILQAAVDVFFEKGFYEATVEEIATRAGVGKGTVYEYFANKEQLFKEMFQEGVDTYLQAIRTHLLGATGSAQEILTRFAHTHIGFVEKHLSLAALIFEGQQGPLYWLRDWWREVKERKVALIRRVVEKGVTQGEFRSVDPRIAAEAFLGLLAVSQLPLVLQEKRGAESSPSREALEQLLDIFFNGVLSK